MLGSSSTTSRRASGARCPVLPDICPPGDRSGAVVVMGTDSAQLLRSVWRLPVSRCETGSSARGGHGAPAPPVADGVVPARPSPHRVRRSARTVRTAADSAATQANTSSRSGGSSAATASASGEVTPGSASPRCSQRSSMPGGRPAAAPPPARRPPAAPPRGRRGPRRPGCGRWPAARSRRRPAAATPSADRRPAGPAEPCWPPPGRRPAPLRSPRPRPAVAVQHEVDVELAGGGVLSAGRVAAQADAVAALRPDDAAVAGHVGPARGRVADPRDQQGQRGLGRRDHLG